MRRMRKKGGKSTEEKSSGLLTGPSRNSSPSLKERVRSLERRVEALEHGLTIDALEEATQKRPGPHPKISDEDLLQCRNALVDCLEVHWPDLGPKLLSAPGPEEIIAALMPFAGPQTSRGLLVQRLIDHASALLSFLKSDRFHRKPPKRTVIDALNRPLEDERRMRAAARLPTRQIANAMAGVPELEWRTSLDRCSRTPSRLFVGKRTEDHYRGLFAVPLPKRWKRQGKP
jgi:hypothetical protein